MPERIPVCEPLLAGNEEAYVVNAVRTGWISSAGPYVERFEKGFAAYCGARHGVSVANGSVALVLALRAAGIGPGDEVILPDFTMVACLSAVLQVGATPVFVDIEPDTMNMDPKAVVEKVTERTRALMVVHLFGHPVDWEPLAAVAEKHDLVVIEDAAEAHGAEYRGQRCGSLGHLSCFSFFANKHLTTGEGGMVLTSSDELHRQLRYYRNLCFKVDGPRDYWHEDVGYNFRFTNLQAAIGVAQLEKLDEYVAARRRNGELYRERLSELPGLMLPVERDGCRNTYWMYAVRLSDEGPAREEVTGRLREAGIDTRDLFQPMHRQGMLAKAGVAPDEGSYPHTEFAARQGFYLPSGSGLTEGQIDRVCEQMAAILG